VTTIAVEPRTTHDPPDPDAELTITTARHPWRWAATAVVAVLVAMAVHALVTNPAWDWPTEHVAELEVVATDLALDGTSTG
jgi:polar amino acid transport system permease protein